METIRAMLKELTFEDLREWAGSKIFDRGKDYVTSVSQLSRIKDGTLVAWVSGADEYTTTVNRDEEEDFDFECTCPFDNWRPCKHVVAVLLAAADHLKRNQEIPLLDPEDDLYLEAFGAIDEFEDATDENDHLEVTDLKPKSVKGHSPQVESILAGKNRKELATLLIDLALDIPEVARRICDAAQLEAGQEDKLVRSLRKEIRKLTAEEAWISHWSGEGNLPNYSHVQTQLRALLEKEHADAVLELGEELWTRGVDQVSHSNDEGETAMALATCLEIVLEALPLTSLSPTMQLLWLVDRELEDEYNLLEGADVVLNDARYTTENWREVAITLEERLQHMALPKSGHFYETYNRERVVKWLRNAYERSGQKQKIVPLLEQEADRCRSYDTLVKALLEMGERERARQWCIKGFNKTTRDAPGIASGLHERLRKIADEEGENDLAAAYRADDFFDRPSENTYIELLYAAEIINVWPTVREKILDYLMTGKRPVSGITGENAWPLPNTEVQKADSRGNSRFERFPNWEMLIEIALLEKRYDDAIKFYEEMAQKKHGTWGVEEKLAESVAKTHPEIALQIWAAIAERLIGHVKPKAYQEAAIYLRKMRKIYQQGDRLADWKALIMKIRLKHKAKRRLMEILNGLEKDRKLID